MNTPTTTQPIYNGYSIREILNKFPKTFSKLEKVLYLKNCIKVFKKEEAGTDSGYIEAVKNSNFRMIQAHYEKSSEVPTVSTRPNSFRKTLNKAVRSPQRTTGTKLATGVVAVEQVFKNKKIINVVSEVEPRFLQTI